MRHLYRSRQRVLAGVVVGIGERFGVNPVVVRAAWLCSVPFTAGLSAAAYVVLAFVLPLAPEERRTAAAPALVPQAFAVFVLAHGLIHVMGFLPAWHLPSPQGFEYTTSFFFNRIDLGDAGATTLGLAWLAVAVAYIGAAALLWRGSRRAPLATVLVSLASAAVCTLSLPLSQVGLVIDVAIVGIVLVAPRLVVVRSASISLSAAGPVR